MTFKFAITPRFDRTLRRLKKRYPRIAGDLANALADIESNPTLGTVIPKDYQIRKARVASSDMKKGKRGGFRILYKLSSEEETDDLIATLLFIYSKTDQSDVTSAFLEALSEDVPEDE
jgi:mRNA-degrading endonuclease RelE of RelBE toxin-antitoxin system